MNSPQPGERPLPPYAKDIFNEVRKLFKKHNLSGALILCTPDKSLEELEDDKHKALLGIGFHTVMFEGQNSLIKMGVDHTRLEIRTYKDFPEDEKGTWMLMHRNSVRAAKSIKAGAKAITEAMELLDFTLTADRKR